MINYKINNNRMFIIIHFYYEHEIHCLEFALISKVFYHYFADEIEMTDYNSVSKDLEPIVWSMIKPFTKCPIGRVQFLNESKQKQLNLLKNLLSGS